MFSVFFEVLLQMHLFKKIKMLSSKEDAHTIRYIHRYNTIHYNTTCYMHTPATRQLEQLAIVTTRYTSHIATTQLATATTCY
jgi:hypothetical protein